MFCYTNPEPQRLTPRGDVYASYVWAHASAIPMARGSRGTTG